MRWDPREVALVGNDVAEGRFRVVQSSPFLFGAWPTQPLIDRQVDWMLHWLIVQSSIGWYFLSFYWVDLWASASLWGYFSAILKVKLLMWTVDTDQILDDVWPKARHYFLWPRYRVCVWQGQRCIFWLVCIVGFCTSAMCITRVNIAWCVCHKIQLATPSACLPEMLLPGVYATITDKLTACNTV